jgi:hypothetical protein
LPGGRKDALFALYPILSNRWLLDINAKDLVFIEADLLQTAAENERPLSLPTFAFCAE